MREQMTTDNTNMAPEGGCPEGSTPCSLACSLPSSDFIAAQMEYFIPRSKFTKRSALTYQQIAQQYLDTTLAQIITGIRQATPEQLAGEQIPIYMDLLRRQNPGQYTYDGKQHDWFDWLLRMHPLFTIVKRGYKHGNQQGTLTMATLNTEIFQNTPASIVAFETPEQTFKRLYSEYADAFDNDDLIDWVAIDTASLGAYIAENKQLNKEDNAKLNEYRSRAEEILKVSEFLHEIGHVRIPALPQIKSPSAFGRMYYRSLNLQNIPKPVRHAALGHYNQYDIVSSVFAWQLHQVNNVFLTPATKELVLYKDAIRQRLVNECIWDTPVEPDTKLLFVKRTITALGFGARLDGGAYFDLETNRWIRNAVSDNIRNKLDRQRFQQHAWVREFVAEQTKITNYIIDNTDTDGIRHIPELWSAKTGKIKPNSVMAYLYQQYESSLMSRIRQLIPKEYEFLLGVHDAFYTRHKLPGTMIQEYAQAINPYIRFERQEQSGWTSHDIEQEREYNKKMRTLINNMNSGIYNEVATSPERERAFNFFAAIDDTLTMDHLKNDPEVWAICEPYLADWQQQKLNSNQPYQRRLYRQGAMPLGQDYYQRAC